MPNGDPTGLRGLLATLWDYVDHAIKVVAVIVLSILIWSIPGWLIGQLVRLGIAPSLTWWQSALENGVVVALLTSFLVRVVENELRIHLCSLRELLALYHTIQRMTGEAEPVTVIDVAEHSVALGGQNR